VLEIGSVGAATVAGISATVALEIEDRFGGEKGYSTKEDLLSGLVLLRGEVHVCARCREASGLYLSEGGEI
jgi:hypothetical protein